MMHATGKVAPPTVQRTLPGDRADLVAPRWFQDALGDAVAHGLRIGDQIGAAPTDPDRYERIHRASLAAIGPVPSAEVSRAELQQLHEIARTRTPEGIAVARWQAAHGTGLLWQEPRAALGSLAAGDARLGTHVLDHALDVLHRANDDGKATFGRPRPFEADSTLEPAVHPPYGNGSYPSGHTSAAVANALVLGSFLTDRRQSLFADAAQAAWARVYGGVHYVSDVLAGARLGAAVASSVARMHGTSIEPTEFPQA